MSLLRGSLVLLLLFAQIVLPQGAVSRADVVDKVLVVVNDEVITQGEFDRIYLQMRRVLESNFSGEELEKQLKQARNDIMEQLINSKLVISLAKNENIEVDEDELQARVEKIRAYYPTEEDFLQALNEKGTTLSEFKRELKDQMLAQELVEKEVASKIVITPGEMRNLYEKNKDQLISRKSVKLRTITFNRGESEAEDLAQKQKAERTLSDLRSGADFAEVATQRSEDGYAASGGDMGYLSPGETLREIDEVVFRLDEGDFSGIVETQIGYHIFKVEDIKTPRQLEFNEVSDFLRQQLHMKKFQEKIVEWLEEKRKNAYISYK